MSTKPAELDERKKQALQAMDYVIQGLQTGMFGIVSGYMDHPVVAASIMEGSVRLYLHSLMIYHDKETAQKYAANMLDQIQPFVDGEVEVDEDTWFESMTPPLLEQLG